LIFSSSTLEYLVRVRIALLVSTTTPSRDNMPMPMGLCSKRS
jgi:hypothetical protein